MLDLRSAVFALSPHEDQLTLLHIRIRCVLMDFVSSGSTVSREKKEEGSELQMQMRASRACRVQRRVGQRDYALSDLRHLASM